MAEATITNTKILYYGLQENYDAITTKDNDILYFCTDSKKIFKGSVEMTEQIRFVASKTGLTPVAGKLYVIADTGTVEIWNGSAWTVVSYPILVSSTGISDSSTDVQVPSAKAVYDYVQGIIAGDSVVTAVTTSTTAGYLDVTTGDDEPVPTVVPGVVTTPSYDASTRTFTFPISDDPSHPVVVELGKDIFIDPEGNNRYENGYIYLYLNDGTQSEDPTSIVIPVTALVTDYFGDNTDTVEVTVDNTTHKVTADVRIRPDSNVTGSEFANLIKVSSEGIYFDRTQLDLDTAAIELLNGADSVTGSVAYAVKQLADGAVATNTAAINVLNGPVGVTGSVASAVNDLATGAVAANTEAINVLNGGVGVTGSVDQKISVVSADVEANTEAIEILNGGVGVTGSVASAVNDLATGAVAANTEAINTLNGGVGVTGSVDQKVNDLATGAVATNTAAITTLNGDASVTGSVDQKLAAFKDAYVDVNAANIAVLAEAQSWGTF